MFNYTQDMGNEVVAFQDASTAVELFKKNPQNIATKRLIRVSAILVVMRY